MQLSASETREDSTDSLEECTQGYNFESLCSTPSSSYIMSSCPEPVVSTDESRDLESGVSISRKKEKETLPSFEFSAGSVEGVSEWFTINNSMPCSGGEVNDMPQVVVDAGRNVTAEEESVSRLSGGYRYAMYIKHIVVLNSP